MGNEERAGEVTHFYGKISVAVIQLSKDLTLGERVQFRGRNTDFEQTIDSMQVEHEAVDSGKAGSEIAVKVKGKVRPGDLLYKLMDDE